MRISSIISPTTSPMLSLSMFMAEFMKSVANSESPSIFPSNICMSFNLRYCFWVSDNKQRNYTQCQGPLANSWWWWVNVIGFYFLGWWKFINIYTSATEEGIQDKVHWTWIHPMWGVSRFSLLHSVNLLPMYLCSFYFISILLVGLYHVPTILWMKNTEN